ncbi:2-oxoglutarate dehydrogenase complex dihydrolipoyllysine-residue succinyltransferase [Paenibacillus sp. GCM10012307]|uniref:Dihydrolipoyllysine-residue succinyltransferase component of 2-oxoglutarate dehydrogenase complex n=1 Tax=Paenibacillus roseus TaxID=2798579 RepID=A0A934J2G5_9BACL|nr:2-oxoglutarate dehydrogenase complex dihydrolipoyllysine-residue succinyltransferase [Paenibacillus roseus]MBJ6361575.1 2-oxoglutarate dehydrogenase complex dihydrolipoyllysine-residue succinyltransferase [Paenibacillus roseus]
MFEVKVPQVGESITEATISQWLVKEGDQINAGDILLELETDKVNMEVTAEAGGVVSKIIRQTGDNVKVGEVVAQITAGGESAVPASEPAKAEAPAAQPEAAKAAPAVEPVKQTPVASEASVVNASPSARKLAREKGIDLNQALGRVGAGDVAAVGNAAPAAPSQPAAVPAKAPVQDDPTVERVKMSRRRQTIAKRLVEAQHTAAMLTTFNEVDMTAIMDVRKRRKQSFADKHDVGLGFMSFFTKAVIGALKQFPLLNAQIEGDEILINKRYDIGIAVSAKEGLVVPVVRDAERLSFAAIEKEITALAQKARANTLALSDLQGGTFTITNGGIFGSLMSTPILNAPQVGILGMHKIQVRPVAIDNERMENRPMMYIALSYDHRIVDGSEAVRFLVTVKELLEDPESLLLEG